MTPPTRLSLSFTGPDGAHATDLYRRWKTSGITGDFPNETLSLLQELAADALELASISGDNATASTLTVDGSRLVAIIIDSAHGEQATSVPADPKTLEVLSALDRTNLTALWMQILLSLLTWSRFSGARSQHLIFLSVGELIATTIRQEQEAADPHYNHTNYMFGTEERVERMNAWAATDFSQCPEPHRSVLSRAARLALDISCQSTPQLAILDVVVRTTGDVPVLALGALEKPAGGALQPGEPLTIHERALSGFAPEDLIDYAREIQPDPVSAQAIWVSALRTVAAHGSDEDRQAALLSAQVNALIPFRNDNNCRPRPTGVRTIIQTVESEMDPAKMLAELHLRVDSLRPHWETLRRVEPLDNETIDILHLLARRVFAAALEAQGAEACIGTPNCLDGTARAGYTTRAQLAFEDAATWSSVVPEGPNSLAPLTEALSYNSDSVTANWVALLGVVAEEIIDEGIFPVNHVHHVLDSSAELIAIRQITSLQE